MIVQKFDMISQPTESVGIDNSGQGDTSEVRVQMRAFRDLSRGAFCFMGSGRASFQGFRCGFGMRKSALWHVLRGKLFMQPLNDSIAIDQQPCGKGGVLLFVDEKAQPDSVGNKFGNGAAIL